jgi:parvulin-like peptidyl-prolyl cis-trans isomerase-like protein
MRKLIREPLLHFLLLGVALFALYGWLNDGLPGSQNEIVVSRGQMRSLEAQFERVWQRSPTPEELKGLIDNWVREEILYREGLVMGLDRGDPVVRRRVAQKVEFILDGAIPAAPTDAELQAWLDSHREKYRVESRYSLRQLYFDPARHGDDIAQVISRAQSALRKGRMDVGDPTLLPAALTASASEVARVFGSEFEIALRTLPPGAWQGPVSSGFGIHLVELQAHDAERKASLNEVREAVTRDLMYARSEAANAAFFERLKATYNVRIDDATDPDPTG